MSEIVYHRVLGRLMKVIERELKVFTDEEHLDYLLLGEDDNNPK